MGTQQFCLKWNNHSSNMLDVFGQLLTSEALVDVTLACDGLSLKAHKLVLSACSPFFQSLFLENPCTHPIIILHNLKYSDLKALIDFMYNGEINVTQDQLTTLLKAAETLKVKGLGEFSNEQKQGTPLKVVDDSTVKVPLSADISLQGRESPASSRYKREKQSARSTSITDVDEQFPLAIEEDIGSNSCDRKPDVHCLDKQSNIDMANVNMASVSKRQCNLETNASGLLSGEEVEFDLEPCRLMEQSMTTENASASNNLAPQQGKTMSYIKKNVAINSLAESDTDNDKDSQSKDMEQSNCFPIEASTTSQDIQYISKDIKVQNGSWCEDFPESPSATVTHDLSAFVMCKQVANMSSLPGPSTEQGVLSVSEHTDSKVGMLSNGELDFHKHGPKRGRKPGSRLCVLCKHIFNCESDLERHMDSHRDGTLINSVEPKTLPVTLAIPDPQSVSEENLVKLPQPCSVCNCVLNTMSDAQSHLTMNPICRTSQFKCPLCPKIFIWPATLTKHFREQHLGPEGTARVTQRLWFFCDICKKPLLSRHALCLHKSKFHGLPLSNHPFELRSPESQSSCKRGRKQGTRVCRLCKRTFTSTNEFHAHLQNSHKNETSFQCAKELMFSPGNESLSSAENESNSAQSVIDGE